jgi:hypothetical protein
MEQDQEVPEFYDDDPKRVMTYSSAAIESYTVKRFHEP